MARKFKVLKITANIIWRHFLGFSTSVCEKSSFFQSPYGINLYFAFVLKISGCSSFFQSLQKNSLDIQGSRIHEGEETIVLLFWESWNLAKLILVFFYHHLSRIPELTIWHHVTNKIKKTYFHGRENENETEELITVRKAA